MTESISVIVPTFHEAENIPHLVGRLQAVRTRSNLDLSLCFMDDDSGDGSDRVVESLGLPWVRLVTRTGTRGLSQAVLDGLQRTHSDFLVVMDADLSHPPEKIPALLAALRTGAELAVGSRFADGGSTADDWGFLRWLNSRIATLLAFPLTALEDPMSGFFAMRRATFDAGRDFNPIGYKILLELIIKCRCRQVVEIPIHFDNRIYGTSKLSLKEQLRYLQHLRRLYIYKYGNWSHLAQFLGVGFSGLGVNLLVLTLLLHWPVAEKPAVGGAIAVSLVWNFFLNRRFSFSYARHQSVMRQFVAFAAACSFGALANYFVTTTVMSMSRYTTLAAVAGVLAGTVFNFTASRFLVFRARHVRP